MNIIEIIEITLVVVTVIVQLTVFYNTLRQILVFKRIIPDTSFITVCKIFVPIKEIENTAPEVILANTFNYQSVRNSDVDTEISTITIIECEDDKKNEVFDNILRSINTYLIRNRNSATDFNLIKDITERNTNAVEEDINLTISIPLFLGLMGTMLGIVIGLFSMSNLTLTGDSGGGDALGQGITTLLGGVKIAMIASFVGLTLTTINSGGLFKGSKKLVEANKNEFYTIIQTELLPVINQSIGATFESLQRNLFRFNNEFTGNLGKFSELFGISFKALELQDNILSKIENIDITKIAKYNINVMKELNTSVEEFRKFNENAANVNLSLETSSALVGRLNDLLERTENLKNLADNIDDKLEQSQNLLNFLSAHFQTLEDYKEKTTQAIAQTGFNLSDVFSDLKVHIENSSQEVKEFTVKEVDLLKQALSESKTNLGNLQYLSEINDEVSLFKDSSASQGERIRKLLGDVNKNLEKSISRMEGISLALKRKSIKNYLKDLFTQNGN